MPAFQIRTLPVLSVLVALVGPVTSSWVEAQAKPACQCDSGPATVSQRAVVLQGGAWLADFDGMVAAARAELPIGRNGRWLLVPGLTFAHGDLLTGPTQSDVFVPEAQLHFQLTQGRFRPYVGGGAGLALVNLLDRTINSVATVASGVRADLSPGWGARLEADLRFFGFEAASLGWSLGVARRF